MRALRLLPLIVTILFIWILNSSWGSLPPIGRLLDPVNGCWTAAEPTNKNFNQHLKIKGLQKPVSIWLEDRLVPHIRAQNNHDLYLAQGYVHAYFRLWQMDLQTRAAGGRVSEVIGKKGLEFDRGQRRKGMVYGAERSLKAMEADPRTKEMLDAYTAGINSYRESLNYRDLPLEYKLMNFEPEPWTNIKCALLLKYMADDLTGKSDDIQFTMLRDQLGDEQFNFLFPEKTAGSKPIIPEGTKFEAPSLKQPAYPGDSVWAHFRESKNSKIKSKTTFSAGSVGNWQLATGNAQLPITNYPFPYTHFENPESEIRNPEFQKDPESGIGSNNWAISGKHTKSGAPILCNDPHLGLNLPSLWFELQLTAPGINTYGASLPGAPGVVIGFNDQLSWGFTNNYRDVKDYYEITANGRETYLFNNRPVPFQKRAERISIKGAPDLVDTVLYTVHGPVQYDATFPDPKKTGKLLAMCWMAHRPTNEVLALYLMNRANNYDAFVAAIQHFECPAQNFAYADKTGNIAMWGQGQFINKWRGQGKFVMEGKDSLTLWGQDIPMRENPHVLNPPQGYVASANQTVTDSTYPYWYNGDFVEFRSWEINGALSGFLKYKAVPVDAHNNGCDYDQPLEMAKLQNQTQSYLLQQVPDSVWTSISSSDWTRNINHASWPWDSKSRPIRSYMLYANSTIAPVFQIWWSFIYNDLWKSVFPKSNLYPSTERTLQLMRSGEIAQYYRYQGAADSGARPLAQLYKMAFKETVDSLNKIKTAFQEKGARHALQTEDETGLEWYKIKNTSLTHLAKIPAFSYTQLQTGGWGNTINAMKQNHGPSWRMIVEMDQEVKAYAVYPGGQSGNPGSRHYGDFIDYWVEGKYYELKFTAAATVKNPFIYEWTMTP